MYDQEKGALLKTESMQSWHTAGARLHYLAGGIFFSLSRYSEAISHLEKVTDLCIGWMSLESRVRRMLFECYGKCSASQLKALPTGNSRALVSSLFDTYVHRSMPNDEFKKVLESFVSTNGIGVVEWNFEFTDENGATLPLSYALTFPEYTHGTAGNQVKASLWLKSNLDCAIQIDAVTAFTHAGPTVCEPFSVVLKENDEVNLTTLIDLPEDLHDMGNDVEGNGDPKTSAGKSSTKTPRPRTSGITAGAGARFISEEDAFRQELSYRSKVSPWSLRCLGGKPLRCSGVKILFSPVGTSLSCNGGGIQIDLSMKKVHPTKESQIKRTPFEEDNYLSSSWQRPRSLSVSSGPECLRLIPPLAYMEVENITEPYTNGRVLEGAVNRIVLKLTAGLTEICSDVKIRMRCSSSFASSDGSVKRIGRVSDASNEQDDVFDMTNPSVRTPVLVRSDVRSKAVATGFGYVLTNGWDLVGNGLGDIDDFSIDGGYSILTTKLEDGEHAYAYFDIFRPCHDATITNEDGKYSTLNSLTCQSEVDVTIRYEKKRGLDSNSSGDFVSLDYKVAVLWTSPVSTVFAPGNSNLPLSSGNRHPSNSAPLNVASPSDKEIVVTDKERVVTACTLEAATGVKGLDITVDRVKFTDSVDENAPCRFKLLGEYSSDGCLYEADVGDPGSKLGFGSKLSFVWTAEANMESAYLKGSVTTTLGIISVYWHPLPLNLPAEVDLKASDFASVHGPLQLSESSVCCFNGPPCYIENAPFDVTLKQIPDMIQVAVPFELSYIITNKTALNQEVHLQVKDADSLNDTFLMAGLINEEVSIAPFECFSFSIMVVPLKIGQVTVPRIMASSRRYSTWILDPGPPRGSTCCVLP